MIMLVVIAKANVSALMQLPAQSCAVPERASNKQASSGVAETLELRKPQVYTQYPAVIPADDESRGCQCPNPLSPEGSEVV